ncbi:MAG: pyruvate, phosphate dikinase [Puniceicoccales bacterium]|jgi:pyruvate,orthophosphate dikinase|nr:pyruvate, phosphate dikinase [Puniceicoccales bacterium]
MSEQNRIYEFGKKIDGDATMKALLGGKGANLAEMARIGLPVPPGFTITTEVCIEFRKNNERLPNDVLDQVKTAIKNVEAQQGKRFGDLENPLLFSVRSGARESMPGMMDTILNLGLNDQSVQGLARRTNNPRFAYDCYRRFIQMYGDVVMGVRAHDDHEEEPFDRVLRQLKNEVKAINDVDLTAEQLQQLIERYKVLVEKTVGMEFPQDVHQQLEGAIGAVFKSWNNERAVIYRRKYNIPSEWGTAVNIQSMVFGNMGNNCATGVAFTRNPANGQREFYGEYLINAQGEDVVAGIRTPQPISALHKDMPSVFEQLVTVCKTLEDHFKDMQDFEFTVEQDKLYMLQTRHGKRTGLAAVRIAVEMVEEGRIAKEDAIRRIPADSISSLLVPVFDEQEKKGLKKLATGLPAGPGAACGKIYFSAKVAEEVHAAGEKVILCRIETSPEDIRGMLTAEGILTSRGGVSSHAALVARQMGKVCVCGAGSLHIDYTSKTIQVEGVVIKEGDYVSIDGTTGEVFAGKVATVPSEVNRVLSNEMSVEASYIYRLFATVMQWADDFRQLGIWTNADTPKQAQEAFQLGAEGIGLCRTEHMFFEDDRIDFMRKMILAPTTEDRIEALNCLKPLQRGDFEGLFREMKGLPVTIRLLDPPLHEFLPNIEEALATLSQKFTIPIEWIKTRVQALHEQNPMLGHRGCRLGMTYPEMTMMQASAIFEAMIQVMDEGIDVAVEVMIPLVAFTGELSGQIALIEAAAEKVMKEKGKVLTYKVGTMLELPRAALIADKIAEKAEFFSFGTNDLTQTTLGMSRDDSGTFLPDYIAQEVIERNPFASIDIEGVGQIMEIAVTKAKKVRPDIKLGICGEHGGDPDSIKFCHKLGLSYVSCAPNRIPVAKIAAAQAALDLNKQGQKN